MSTFNNSVVTDRDDVGRAPEGFDRQFVGFFRECRRRMGMMKADFEAAGDGSRSRARSAERLRDEEAWSRTYDEELPKGQQP